jgi:hypothetical protein
VRAGALCSVGALASPALRWLGFYGGGGEDGVVVAACARETRLVFLLEADTHARERAQ